MGNQKSDRESRPAVSRPDSSGRPSAAAVILWILPGLLLGPQFVAGAFLGMSFGLQRLPAVMLVVALVGVTYFSSGLGAVVVASATGAVIGLRIRKGPLSIQSCALAAGAAVLAVAISSLWREGLMALSASDFEFMLPFYASAGIPVDQARELLEVIAYLSPGLGAIQAVLGAAVACVVAELVAARRASRRVCRISDFRLGMLPAYLTMGLLAVNLVLLRLDLPPALPRSVHNCLLFMALPYGLVGLSILRAALRQRESAVLLIVALTIIFPPLVLAGLVLAGMVDPWLDLHARIRSARAERNTP